MRWALTAVAASTALFGSFLTSPASAAPIAPPCPAAVPLSTVTPGLTGRGMTVVRGTDPQEFAVEVLGVLKDGIAAGRDLIVVKVSDLSGSHVIDQGGGIWAGMSGSPVYVGGRLLGSVSYGFSGAPSPIGGVTPAAQMYDLLSLPTGSAEASSKARTAKQVRLSSSARRALSTQAGGPLPEGSMRPLVTPLAVSGLRPKRLDQLQRDADRAGLAVKAYPAGSVPAPSGVKASATPVPGGNFASMVSYGDVTVGAIGTTTAVCGSKALAFGHPFAFAGPVQFGANGGNALTIVEDSVFGSYKLANVVGSYGLVDQDRLAGLRADLNRTPKTVRIATTVRNSDTGRSRTGTTRVVDKEFSSEIALFSALGNVDSVFDEIGDGTAVSYWTIKGRAGGEPFTVSRSNRWASRYDVAVAPALEMASALDTLQASDPAGVTIDDVAMSATLSTAFQQYHVSGVKVSVNGGKFRTRSSLKVKPGARLRIRVDLSRFRSNAVAARTTLAVRVPKSMRGKSGELAVIGGQTLAEANGNDLECLLDPDSCGEADSIDDAIDEITSAPQNNAVVATLGIDLGGDDEELVPVAGASTRQSLTVTGAEVLPIRVKRR